jgi:phage terminase large subunit-like protein
VRAQSIRGKIALDGLHVPVRAPWHAAFRQEFLTFPQGRTDDIIDCLALVGRMLPALLSGRKAKKAAAGFDPDRDPYRPRETENNDSFKLL